VEDALQRDSEADRMRRTELAARNGWETRTGRLLELVEKELEAGAPELEPQRVAALPGGSYPQRS
jgi:hypothetical protein